VTVPKQELAGAAGELGSLLSSASGGEKRQELELLWHCCSVVIVKVGASSIWNINLCLIYTRNLSPDPFVCLIGGRGGSF